jgi:hypothetical protein
VTKSTKLFQDESEVSSHWENWGSTRSLYQESPSPHCAGLPSREWICPELTFSISPGCFLHAQLFCHLLDLVHQGKEERRKEGAAGISKQITHSSFVLRSDGINQSASASKVLQCVLESSSPCVLCPSFNRLLESAGTNRTKSSLGQ